MKHIQVDLLRFPEKRRHRSFSPIWGFEVYELLALGVLGILLLPYWQGAILAMITAAGLQPIIRKIENRWHVVRGTGAFMIVGVLSAAMIGMTAYSAIRVARLTVDFAGSAKVSAPKEVKGTLMGVASRLAPSYQKDVESFLNTLPKNFVTWLASHAQGFVSNSLEILFQMGFYFLFLFLFLSKGKSVMRFFLRKLPDSQMRVSLWYELVETASYTSVVSAAAIGFIQAVIVTSACLILGYPEWGLIFFASFILSFMPMLGPASIPFLLAVSALISGDSANAAWLAVVCAFVGTIDNVLRSWFATGDTDINPILSFIALIGAITLLGFPGLLIGPFLICMAAMLLGDRAKEGFRPL